MTTYSSKLNKATVKKLSNTFNDSGIEVIQDEVNKNWDEDLHGAFAIPLTVCIESSKIMHKCRSIYNDDFLSSVSHVNFEFNPEKDMEVNPSELAPIGSWIKASEVDKYDFSYLGCADVLLRKTEQYYSPKEKELNISMDYKSYIVGFLQGDEVCFGADKDDTVLLNSGDYDIMIIKLDTDK